MLDRAKVARKASKQALGKARGRAEAAAAGLETATVAAAGAGTRSRDTPCPVCRSIVPWQAVEGWFHEVQGDDATPPSPPPALDTATTAYLTGVRQTIQQGLRRQLAAGGILAQAEEAVRDIVAGT